MTMTKSRSEATHKRLAAKAERYRAAQTKTEEARSVLDAAVAAASDGGMSYREIADAIGTSLGWVQASLSRTTGKPLRSKVAV